jgi:hypothetical protein
MNKSKKGMAQFLIARCNASKLFEFIEESFDLLTESVEVLIIVYMYSTVALGRDDRDNVTLAELLSDIIAVITLIHDRMRQLLLLRHLRKHGFKHWALMTLSFCEHKSNTGVFIYTAGMDFGGQTTPRASQSLCGVPPFFFNAPAAC